MLIVFFLYFVNCAGGKSVSGFCSDTGCNRWIEFVFCDGDFHYFGFILICCLILLKFFDLIRSDLNPTGSIYHFIVARVLVLRIMNWTVAV